MSRIKTCVSLYSLQYKYLRKEMTLEELLRFVKDLGAEGVEILPDQNIKGAPDPSAETIADWNRMVQEVGITPACADVFLNTNLYKNRTLTKKECIELLKKEIRNAHDLGFHLIRLVSMVPAWVCEPLLPYCEKYDVAIALEVHAGMAFDIPETKAFIEECFRLNSPYLGIVVDTGIFCRKFPRVEKNYQLAFGASPEMFAYIDDLFAQGSDLKKAINAAGGELPEGYKACLKTPQDHMMSVIMANYENNPVDILEPYLPIIKHFHFKLYEMVGEDKEYSIDYKEILQYLHDHDYDGYVSTEYEGNRSILPGEYIPELEQVAAHQKHLQKCLKEIQG